MILQTRKELTKREQAKRESYNKERKLRVETMNQAMNTIARKKL